MARIRSHVELDTVGKGQEFIFDTEVYPEALGWFATFAHEQMWRSC